MLILGLDPGSRHTGYGVVEAEGARLRHVSHGVIHVGDTPWPQRLGLIHAGIEEVVLAWRPGVAAAERVFMARNPDSALKLGQARGAALAALIRAGLGVHEYTPAEVKQAIVGTGRAAKEQIQHMTRILLNLPEAAPEDAADALAVAICHAQMGAMRERLAAAADKYPAPPVSARRGRGRGLRGFKP